jgi:hypothetical protein
MKWEDLLKSQNWQNYYNCTCKGGKRSFYNNKAYPHYEVKVNRTRGTFSILCKNHIVGSTDWLYNLQTKLTAHGIFNASDQAGTTQEQLPAD